MRFWGESGKLPKPTDLPVPECDRCQRQREGGGVMNFETMEFVCFNCMTPAELKRMASNQNPFKGGDDE